MSADGVRHSTEHSLKQYVLAHSNIAYYKRTVDTADARIHYSVLGFASRFEDVSSLYRWDTSLYPWYL